MFKEKHIEVPKKNKKKQKYSIELNTVFKTRAVLVFATERKNNVNPCLRSQKKVSNIQLFFTK